MYLIVYLIFKLFGQKQGKFVKRYKNIIIFLILFSAGAFIISETGISSQLSIKNIPKLKEQFLALGWLAYLSYFFLYALLCLFFLPMFPTTILGSILFGPLLTTLLVVSASSIGLAMGFLIARYTFRDFLLEKFGSSRSFKRIDQGVKEQGWRILIITRLIPFPFSLQNYMYGLTDIKFLTYWGLSTLFLIPGTLAYTFSAGAVLSGEYSTTNLIYLGLGALCFVGLSFVPKFLKIDKITTTLLSEVNEVNKD